jgi:hypothetical protein
VKFEVDRKEVIKKIFDKVIADYPDDFAFVAENAKFIFTFRDKPMRDDEGNMIAAFAKAVSNRERDIYGTDFEICVFEELWDELTAQQKEQLVYHEMLHCRVVEDEEIEGEPAYDNDGRVIIYIEPHDVIVKTFKREIEVFGLQRRDLDVSKFLALHYKKYKDKRVKDK